jgi:hypothetical protein
MVIIMNVSTEGKRYGPGPPKVEVLYKVAHDYRRWRNLLLAPPSASYLDICLARTPGIPGADMSAHFPPTPLIIDHVCSDFDVSEDEGRTTACTQAV